MTARPVPAESPPLAVVLPFFLAAPLGLVAGGVLLATAPKDVLVGINLPRTVAMTHAIVVGWASTTVMGATYQLSQAVLGGRVPSYRLARAQGLLHLASVPVFVFAVYRWDVALMGVAGSAVAASFLLFVGLAGFALARTRRGGAIRMGMGAGMAGLVATLGMGLLWLGALQWQWFPITLGRLSAHAQAGLVGWLGLTIMGVSDQLVPMFSLGKHREAKWPAVAIVVTATGLVVFAAGIATDPGRDARVVLAALLVPGPALWAWGLVQAFLGRARRRVDIHGRATMLSLPALGTAAIVGMGAAYGTPFMPDEEAARWLLAYGALLVGGFVGATLIANSLKIVPFLVWFHRYHRSAGRGPVPLIADLVNVPLQHAALAGVVAGTWLTAVGALAGSMLAVHAGGVALAFGGTALTAALAWSLLPAKSSRQPPAQRRQAG